MVLSSRQPPISGAVDLSTVVLRDGTHPLTANWDVGAHKLTNVADPTAAQDAATKAYVDSVAAGLPAGTNGAVLAYSGPGWAATAAGTVGQFLMSTGGGYPIWSMPSATDVGAMPAPLVTGWGALFYDPGAAEYKIALGNPSFTRQVLVSNDDGETCSFSSDVRPLTQRAIDGLGTAVSVVATFAHDLLVGNGGAGIGARTDYQARNSTGSLVQASAIDGVLTTATSGAEVGAIDLRTRTGGSLARTLRVAPDQIRLDWAARAIRVLAFDNVTELDVWTVDGSNRWTYGSTNATNCGGLILYTPSTADLYVYRGATAHWQIDSSGNSILGTTSHTTTLRGVRILVSGAVTAYDAVTNAVSNAVTFAHTLSSGTAAANIGVRITLAAQNATGTQVDASALDGVLTTVTSGAEVAVLDVRVRSSGSLARVARFAADSIRLDWAARALTVLAGDGVTVLDVWRVNGSNYWVYGTTNGTNSGGTLIYAPSGGEFYLYRGATIHIGINGSGALTLGTTSHATTLRGSSLAIGLTTVVAVYQGGARVPERTLTTSTTLDERDEVVFVDMTSGAVTLTLPTGASGRVLAIQRIAGTNNVVINRASSPDTIRAGGSSALTSWTISDGARHGLIYRSGGTEWVAEA